MGSVLKRINRTVSGSRVIRKRQIKKFKQLKAAELRGLTS